MALEEQLDKVLNEESATSKAVSSLIEVKPNKKEDFGTDIEVKTDLTSGGVGSGSVTTHTVAKIIGHILNSDKSTFKNLNIHNLAVDSVERKRLSLNRLSRREIVEVSKNPDQNVIQEGGGGGFVRGLFQSRRNRE